MEIMYYIKHSDDNGGHFYDGPCLIYEINDNKNGRDVDKSCN